MSFNDIPKIEEPDFYIDLAFKRANSAAYESRANSEGTRKDKSKIIERAKLNEIKHVIIKQMELITKSFPSLDDLPEFYKEMIKAIADFDELKKALGAIQWVSQKTSEFTSKYESKISKTWELQTINQHRREYYGRISSLLKQIKKELALLEKARKGMREFPQIKTKMFTIAILGFPNVGKTTLLSQLTESKPNIQNYAFTTVNINVGYMKAGHDKIQVLDTPGTLNRFNKMNPIEKQAYLAVKYCADLIIYIFDVAESSYPITEQEELIIAIKEFDKPTLFYLSKTEMQVDKELVERITKKYKPLTLEQIKKEILKRKPKHLDIDQ